MAEKLLSGKRARLVFTISAAAFVTLQLYVKNTNSPVQVAAMFANILLAFVLAHIFERKFNVLDKLFENRSVKPALISLIIAVYALCEIAPHSYERWIVKEFIPATNPLVAGMRNLLSANVFESVLNAGFALVCIFALFFIFAASYGAISRLGKYSVRKIWNDTEKTERVYFIAAVLALGALIAYVYSRSTAFSGTGGYIDIIYNFDSGTAREEYLSLCFGRAGDVRRFFLPLVYSPIVLVAGVLEKALFFIPFSFAYFVQLCGAVLMVTGGILLSRLLDLKGFSKALFLVCYTVSYPFLVFSITLDKYVISAFCVILLVYACVNELRAKPVIAQAAAGAMTTNIIFFPYLSYGRSIKTWPVQTVKYVLVFLVICIFCGQLSVVANSVNLITDRLSYFGSEGVTWGNKALQFINFVGSCFIKPDTAAAMNEDGNLHYRLAQPAGISIPGILLIAASAAGFIINRKNRFAQLSLFWAVCSFLVLFIIGWQSAQNEMFLSSLYFGWVFISLIFMLGEKLFEKCKTVKNVLYCALLAAMAAINIPAMIELINFGIENYPLN